MRSLFLAVMAASWACVTATPSKRTELEELRAEVRALREENATLERRLERLEARAPTAAPGAPNQPKAAEQPLAIPELTVVKLKPRKDPAPKVSTQVAIVEPSQEAVADILASSTEGSGTSADQELIDAEFDSGLTALKTGNVAGGVLKLQRFVQDHPKDARADNALFFAGVGLMGLSDYEGAATSFETLIKGYPAGDSLMDGMLKLAECRVQLNQKQVARDWYSRVVANYPGTAAAVQAEQRLASLSK